MRFTRALDLSSCWLHLSFAPGKNILVTYHIALSCGPAGQLDLVHLCVKALISKMYFIKLTCVIASVVWCWIMLGMDYFRNTPIHW